MARCPICDKDVLPRADNASFPFCGARCKTIDLGKWVSEEYRIAGSELDPDEAEGESERGSNSNEDVRH